MQADGGIGVATLDVSPYGLGMSRPEQPSGDYVAKSQGAALGARLRRLSASIDADAARIYELHGFKFEQRWFGMINQLALNGPMTVGELASALGISHPSVSETRRSLERAGHIRATSDPEDSRRRLLSLSDSGIAIVKNLKQVWQRFDEAALLLDDEAGKASEALERLERALKRRSLFDRVVGV